MSYRIYIPKALDLYIHHTGAICPPHWIYMSNKRCETVLYDVEEVKDDFSSIFCVLFYSGWTEYD